ncbi:ABC transporter ATP-binding protein [Tumebacillus sp. ITR2]|uniref:ABC transporter ATP-binding protein n=1 Tax=Tumebacillus amylolyticus TaxID=2801339 RepID=A0ABS1J593_9BACL|nr:ABC transporter ATP-binding protein [Tumebacillus amylolyticus]MBL0385355.1 ABC transporter ATP-binding protein [Tumebacillus amylolyticus]
MSNLQTRDLSISYGKTRIVEGMNLEIPEGKITVFIGSNGSGKSTLLRSMARLLNPESGAILLDGHSIQKMPTKQVAAKLSILPQGPVAPEGLTVRQLVKQGRYPHQSWLQQWSEEDERMVQSALEATGIAQLADQAVDALSGGQRQRAWIAMSLAQGTEILLLDEPTTYLDMTHQIEVLDILQELNENEGRTVVMVLHDLNLSCRYADHIVAIKKGSVYAEGSPEDIITPELVRDVFNMESTIIRDPLYGTPMCVPFSRTLKADCRGGHLLKM